MDRRMVENVREIGVHLVLGVVSGVDGGLLALELFDAPEENFDEPGAVEMDGGEEIEEIVDELLLDEVVEEGVGGETGGLVDFDEPALAVLVDHDVVAEELEAVGVVRDVRLAGDQRLAADFAHLSPDLAPPHVHQPKLLLQHPQRDLRPAQSEVRPLHLRVLVLLLLPLRLLVYSHVRQVDLLLIQILNLQAVSLTTHSRKSFSIHKCLQRVETSHHHVNPHVKFEISDQQRILYVFLYYYWL